MLVGIMPPKTVCPMPSMLANSTIASTVFGKLHSTLWFAYQRSSTGETISAPVVSPSHHVRNTGLNCGHGASPATQRLVAPMDALMTVLTSVVKNAKRKIVHAELNAALPLAKRVIR